MHYSQLLWRVLPFVYIVADIVLSVVSLGFYHDGGLYFDARSLDDQLSLAKHGYHFTASGIEFLVMAAARCAILVLGAALILRYRVGGAEFIHFGAAVGNKIPFVACTIKR